MKKGFTLIEILVVLVILSLIAAVVIPRFTGRVDEAKIDTTKLQLKEIKRALEMFKLDNGFYPNTDQGLKALVEKPTLQPEPKKWKKYLDTLPKDGWGNDFVYVSPSDKNPFELKSKGPDGELGTGDDLNIWEMQ